MGDTPMVPLKLRNGTCRVLEEEADRLIAESLKGVTSRSAKSDILTPWKQEDRRNREIYPASGIADPAVRRGMFRRAWNPRHAHLNSRDGQYPPQKISSITLESTTGDGEHSYYDE